MVEDQQKSNGMIDRKQGRGHKSDREDEGMGDKGCRTNLTRRCNSAEEVAGLFVASWCCTCSPLLSQFTSLFHILFPEFLRIFFAFSISLTFPEFVPIQTVPSPPLPLLPFRSSPTLVVPVRPQIVWETPVPTGDRHWRDGR